MSLREQAGPVLHSGRACSLEILQELWDSLVLLTGTAKYRMVPGAIRCNGSTGLWTRKPPACLAARHCHDAALECCPNAPHAPANLFLPTAQALEECMVESSGWLMQVGLRRGEAGVHKGHLQQHHQDRPCRLARRGRQA